MEMKFCDSIALTILKYSSCDRQNTPIELSLFVLFAYLWTSVLVLGHIRNMCKHQKLNCENVIAIGN